jgi:hypothetical protein
VAAIVIAVLLRAAEVELLGVEDVGGVGGNVGVWRHGARLCRRGSSSMSGTARCRVALQAAFLVMIYQLPYYQQVDHNN